MLKYIFFLLCLAVNLVAIGQLHDNTWITGWSLLGGGTKWDVSNHTLSYDSIPICAGISNASMSDAQGNLLFYTNGFQVVNRYNEIMENGDSLNYGQVYQNYPGNPNILGCLALPNSQNSNLYYLFTEKMEYTNSSVAQPIELNYYIVDIDMNNGKGGVLFGGVLLHDTLAQGHLRAIKHANGRDWWVVVPQYRSNKYYLFLVTSSGVYGPYSQNIGPAGKLRDFSGTACFSQLGDKYARYTDDIKLLLMDFDRCNGKFANPLVIPVDSVTPFGGGVAFSPNGRFLYLTNFYTVTQFDLTANDIGQSRDTVAVYDGFMGYAQTSFFHLQLAVDNKIYITSSNGIKYFHIIEQPNNKGDSCTVIQHGLELPTINMGATIPNFPNYRLGALAGSACDTLKTGIVKAEGIRQEVRLYPNPATDKLHISTSGIAEPLTCVLFNAIGQEVRWYALAQPQENSEISLANLPKGVYYCRVLGREKVYYADKIVKE